MNLWLKNVIDFAREGIWLINININIGKNIQTIRISLFRAGEKS